MARRDAIGRFVLYGGCVPVLVFLLLPSLVIVPMALTKGQMIQFPPIWISVHSFTDYLDDPQWFDSTVLSFQVAALAVAIGCVTGGAAAVALLADGVPVDKLYPLDVERGLKSFEKLGRNNIIWYTANQEPIQQLTSGAVSLATVFHGRILLANKGGAQLAFTPAYSAVSGNYLTVIRTTGQPKEAFELINFILSDPQAGANYMKDTNYAVPDAAAFPLLPKSVQDILPTSPAMRDKVFFKNDAWWAENLGPTVQRFKEWQLAG